MDVAAHSPADTSCGINHQDTSHAKPSSLNMFPAKDSTAKTVIPAAAPRYEDRLSNELWTMVLESLGRGRKSVRLVSRKFDSLYTPILYREFTLSRNILDPPDPVTARVADHFRRHTRYVVISEELDWDKAVDMLAECRAFQYLDWALFPDEPWSFPRQFQLALSTNLAHIKLHIAILHKAQRDWAGFQRGRTISLPSIPPSNIISLYVDERLPEDDLADFLLSAKRLQRLDIWANNTINVPEGNKLPPLRELTLGCNVKSTASIWNFSQLESLHVPGLHFIQFGAIQPASTFPVLRILSISHNSHRGEDTPEFAEQLGTVIGNLDPLEELSISVRCHLGNVFKAITKHACTLKYLRINDYPPLSIPVSQTTISHYEQFQEACVKLKFLDVAVGVFTDTKSGEDNMSFPVEILAGFTSLRALDITFRTQAGRSLWDKGFHAKVKDSLCLQKRGVNFSNIFITFAKSFQIDLSLPSTEYFCACAGWDFAIDGTEEYQESIT